MDTSGQGAGTPPPPGWFPDPYGQAAQRYWDGARWTEHVSGLPSGPSPRPAGAPDTGTAQLAHILGLLTGFLGPVIIYLVKKDDRFVEQHAREALNFQITVLLALVVAGLLSLLLVGLLLLPVILIVDLVFCIQQTIRAGQAEPSEYPLSIRLIQ